MKIKDFLEVNNNIEKIHINHIIRSNEIVTENTVYYVGKTEDVPENFYDDDILSIEFIYSGGMIQALIEI